MARSGWSIKGASTACSTPWRKFGTRIEAHFVVFARLDRIDRDRTRMTLVQALCARRDIPCPLDASLSAWTEEEIERALGRSRGTGCQTLRNTFPRIAALLDSDAMLTEIDLAEATAQLPPLTDRERRMQREVLEPQTVTEPACLRTA